MHRHLVSHIVTTTTTPTTAVHHPFILDSLICLERNKRHFLTFTPSHTILHSFFFTITTPHRYHHLDPHPRIHPGPIRHSILFHNLIEAKSKAIRQDAVTEIKQRKKNTHTKLCILSVPCCKVDSSHTISC